MDDICYRYLWNMERNAKRTNAYMDILLSCIALTCLVVTLVVPCVASLIATLYLLVVLLGSRAWGTLRTLEKEAEE